MQPMLSEPAVQPVPSRLKKLSRATHKAIFPSDFPPDIRRADGPQSALRSYIDYYRKLAAPGFAVLVTGAWGIGKTHQVLHSLDADEFLHISLFGMRTAEDLRSAVFAQMYPSRHRIKGLVNDAKNSMHAASGFFALGGITPALMSAFLEKTVTTERVLVFDDLERCRMPLKVLLGVINAYVEHSGCRVIVIVHDKKLVDPYLKDAKEKLFGQTLEALPQREEAFAAFMAPHRGSAFGDFVTSYEQDVLDIFVKSGRPSLRLLKYLTEDLRRFHAVVDARHRENREAMAEVIKMISVFAIEVRDGVMSQTDLTGRHKHAGDVGSMISKANTRYGTIKLQSDTLQDELLTDMFIKGIFNAADISRNLDDSVHFFVPATDPPWRIVINFDKLDDEVVELAVKHMNEQIATLENIAPGEMLHILALRLMMAEQSISGQAPDTVVAEAMAYIDAMLEVGKIPARPATHDWHLQRFDAYDETLFWVPEAMRRQFQQIVDHLKAAQEEALERTLQEARPGLIDAMQDGKNFFELLVTTYTGKNPFAHVSVLDMIEPKAFIDAWLASPKPGWYWICNTISERYKASFHNQALRRERTWARQVVSLLQEEVAKHHGFARYRLSRIVPVIGGPEDDVEPKILDVARLDGASLSDPFADSPLTIAAENEAAIDEPPARTARKQRPPATADGDSDDG